MFLGRKTGWVEILTVHGSLAGLAAIQARLIRHGQTMPWPPEKYCFADVLYYFDRRFRSQVTARPELNLFNIRHRSLAFGIAVFGCFPAKIHQEMPKNHPKRKLNQSKGESKWSQVTVAESTVEIVQ
jgi:hypothetical protein